MTFARTDFPAIRKSRDEAIKIHSPEPVSCRICTDLGLPKMTRRSFLTLRTKMRSSSTQNNSLDRRFANSARQSRAQIDVMFELEEAFLAISIHVI